MKRQHYTTAPPRRQLALSIALAVCIGLGLAWSLVKWWTA